MAPSVKDHLSHILTSRTTLRDLKVNSPFPGSEDPFSTLAEDLCDLVEKESLKPDGCRARWVWAVACLNSLAGIKVGSATYLFPLSECILLTA